MKRHILLLLGFLFLQLNPVFGHKIVIQDINEKYGLPKNRVNCMFQDSMGFLWFGMVNGLYKFNLNTFNKYSIEKNSISGFPEADVQAITEFEPGILLVGTNKGLFIFNTYTDKYDSVRCPSLINFERFQIICIHRQKNGVIWIGTDRGLFRIKKIKNQKNNFELLNQFTSNNASLRSNIIIDIKESPEGKIWFLTMADVGFFNSATEFIELYEAYGANSAFTFIDNNKILLSSFGTGLKLFNTENNSFENITIEGLAENPQSRYVLKDSNSKIWFSISNVGLSLLDSITQRYEAKLISNKYDQYSELNSNVIYQIGESRDGAIWVCTEEGINMINLKPEVFNSHSFKSDRNPELTVGIRSLMDSEKGFLWVGTIGGGLIRYDLNSQTTTKINLICLGEYIGMNIQAIIQDYKDNLWLGTEGEGVIKFIPDKKNDYKKGTTINYRIYPTSFPENNTLLNDFIMCLLEDSHKNIWIGTWNGLSLLDSFELSKPDQSEVVIRNFLNIPNDNYSLSNNTIMSLLEDKKGNIWVGTQGGINKIIKTKEGYKFEHEYKNKHGASLTEKNILVINEDDESNLWFSTQDGGICCLDTKSGIFKEYNSENGFLDNIINSISEDSMEIFWLGTNSGLCRFDPSNRSFNMYYTDDGLISNDFFFNSNCKVGNILYYGGNKGLTFFNPNEIIPPPIETNLVFTDFRLFNKPVKINGKGSPLKKHISFLNNITLKHNQNYFTIAFAALNYKQQNELQYTCMMEGLEGTWNKLDRERKITYTNLKPGDYKFRVRAYNTGHYNNYKEIFLNLAIKPPVWKTIWAYIVYTLLLILIILKIYQYFLNEEKKKHSLEIERMNAKRIHEMDMMKLQFYTNINHELRTPLTLISAPLETLMNEKIEQSKVLLYYQIMLNNVQRLKRLIDQLLDLRKIEEGYLNMEWTNGDLIDFIKKVYATFENYAEKRNMFYTFQSSCSQLYSFFDADKLDKVLFNLLSNAFKYTPDYGSISLKLEEKNLLELQNQKTFEKYLEIKISDSGIGIPKESMSKIFKPFQQVSNNKPIGIAGSGIGLSLTKELVDLHNGIIMVESVVNSGSVFTVFIPVIKNIPESDSKKDIDQNVSDNIDIKEVPTSEEQSKNNEEEKTAIKPLVLIVEDNTELRTFLNNELRDFYRIIEAPNGQEGLKAAQNEIPDLIISDVMMDKMDGIKLCRKIKTDQRTSHIPVILLTARHSEEIRQKSYNIGADDYITKPFNIALLQARIKNLITQRRNLRKLFSTGNMDFSTIAANKTDTLFLEKLNKVIDQNIDNQDFNPISLASDMAMSKMQLYRKISALTNQTVYNYIRTIRMNKAATLLLTTDMQIAEVAFDVGYTEPSNFTKCFSRQFNQTPSQFVKEHNKL